MKGMSLAPWETAMTPMQKAERDIEELRRSIRRYIAAGRVGVNQFHGIESLIFGGVAS